MNGFPFLFFRISKLAGSTRRESDAAQRVVGDALLLGGVVDGKRVGAVGTIHGGSAGGEVEAPLVGLLRGGDGHLGVVDGLGGRGGEQGGDQGGEGGRVRGQRQRGRGG